MPNVTSFNCPTCNAPLKVTGTEIEVRCEFCGNLVVVPAELRNPPASGQTPPSGNVVLGSGSTVQPVSASSSGCGLPAILAIVILGVVAAGVAGIVLFVSVPSSGGPSVASTVAPVLTTTLPPVTLVATFGGEGTGAGMFTEPTEFAVDGKGYVYVSDRDTGLIQRFDPDGHYVSQWQAEPGAEYGPVCLTADHAGNVFACGNSALLKFDGATGKLLAKFTGDTTQHTYFRSSAAALLDGSVLVYETNSDQIFKLDKNGKVLNHSDKISDHLAKRSTTFNVQIAVDGLGNSFVLETISRYVMAYKSDGTFINRFGGTGDAPDQLRNALAIAVDNQSRLYMIDVGLIKLFDHDGHYLSGYPLPPAANNVSAFGMGFDDTGNLFVLGSDKKIYKLKFAGSQSQ